MMSRVPRILLILSVMAFLLMLGHRSDTGTILGRYSLSYGVMLGVTIISIVVIAAAWLRVQAAGVPFIKWQASPAILWGVLLCGSVALVAYYVFLPGAREQPAIALFRAYSGGLLAVALCAVLVIGGGRQIAVSGRVKWGLIIFGIVGAIVLSLPLIGRVPASLHFDEAWLTNWGWSMAVTGEPVTLMYPQHGAARAAALSSALYPVMGGWLQIVGISLFNARLFYLLVAWTAAPFIYLTAREIYGKAAAFAALMIAVLLPLAHNYVRADPLIGTGLAASLYFFIMAEKSGARWRYLLAGFCAALMLEGHLLGLRYIVAWGVFLTVRYLWRIRERGLYADAGYWSFVAGGVLFGLLFAVYHSVFWGVAPLDALGALTGGYETETTLGTSTPLDVTLLWLREFVVRHTAEAALLIAGIVGAVWRRTAYDRLLLVLLFVGFIALIVLTPKYNFYYFVHHLPLVALLAAALIAQAARRILPTDASLNLAAVGGTFAAAALIVGHILALSSVTQSAAMMIDNGYRADEKLPDSITAVAGSQAYFYGLSDRRFYGVEAIVSLPPDEWQAQWGTPPPQALVLTRGLDSELDAVMAFIDSAGLELSACLPLDIHGGQTLIFTMPDVSENADGC